jgi:8-oxo-dGTP diphosphatase
VVVDAANVVGARPDGWWRDRIGATRRLRARLGGLVRDGIAASSLPFGVSPGGLDSLLPEVTLVVEGAARPLADAPAGSRWWDAANAVAAAPRDGDRTVVDVAGLAMAAGRQTVVVTADRGLRRRLGEGVHVTGPAWLLGQLELIRP